jgi:hypothetical protein
VHLKPRHSAGESISLATGVVRDRDRDSGRRVVRSALIEMLANLHC